MLLSSAVAMLADEAKTRGAKAATSQPKSAASNVLGSGCFDIHAYGAIGDEHANDTAAIQKTIDACAGHGGGMVLVRNGRFLIGSLILRSHVELHLASNAMLLGVPDLKQYHADSKEVYKTLRHSLIFAEGCEHIAITGEGAIDGRGKGFPSGQNDLRPVLIRLRDCSNVRLEGFLAKDAASFAIHPIRCRQMRVEGVRIHNRVQPNNDGIDVDGCQNVFISNCNISSIDDSIALKAMEPSAPCQDVVITNCILSSDCAAIRVGPDAVSNIERVTASNCVIRNTGMNGIKIQSSFGVDMRDMTFSNMVMDRVRGPISLRLSGWKMGADNIWAVFDDSHWQKGQLRNILFDNIRARVAKDSVKSGISITGAPGVKPEQITFSNLDISFPGGGTVAEGARRSVPDLERAYPEYCIFGVLPAYGFYAHHVRGITLNNVQFHLDSDDFRPAIVCDDVQNVQVTGLQAEGRAQAESLLRLQDTQSVFITGTKAAGSIAAFLRVEGGGSQRIVLRANDLEAAGTVLSLGDKVPAAAVLCHGQASR
jgi:polygalacturonase